MVPKAPKETTQISKVELPAWVDKAARSNYGLAEEIAAKPYQPYTGATVAATDPWTTRASNYFNSSLNVGQPQINHANSAFTRANNLAFEGGKGIAGMDRSKYMNPFTSEVIDRSLTDMDRSRQLALKSNASGATKDHTFGGSRSAIVDALTNSESVRSAGDMAARLRSQGFDTASGLMQGDVQNKLAAATSFGGTGRDFMGLADAQQKRRMGNFAGMTSIGDKNQQQTQRGLDDLKGRFDEKKNFDLERLNVLLSSLGMSPYGKTENTVKTEKGGGGTDFAQMGAGILSLLPSLFALSDRTEKKDIKKVGKEPITGLDIYSFRYKGAKPDTPKVIGPMAQDIEKLMPGAVISIGKKKAVRRDVLDAVKSVFEEVA